MILNKKYNLLPIITLIIISKETESWVLNALKTNSIPRFSFHWNYASPRSCYLPNLQSKNEHSKATCIKLAYLFKTMCWEKLPSTKGSFIPAMKKVNYYVIIWNQNWNLQPNPIPNSVNHEWVVGNDKGIPNLCEVPCTLDSILRLQKYSCSKNICSAQFRCLSCNLYCIEMC